MAHLKANIRKQANNALHKALPGNYYDGVPLERMFDTLKAMGLIVLDEAGEPWQGFLCGREGSASLRLGNGMGEVYDACLVFTWYKMGNGQYELVKYIS